MQLSINGIFNSILFLSFGFFDFIRLMKIMNRFIDSMNRIFPKNLQKNRNNSMDLLQVLIGSRQVGKTTAILELAKVLIY